MFACEGKSVASGRIQKASGLAKKNEYRVECEIGSCVK